MDFLGRALFLCRVFMDGLILVVFVVENAFISLGCQRDVLKGYLYC